MAINKTNGSKLTLPTKFGWFGGTIWFWGTISFFLYNRFFSSHLPILDVIKANVFYGEIYGENNDDNVIITMMVDMFENKGDEYMLPSPF